MVESLSVDFAIITAIEIERRAVCDAFAITDNDRVRQESRTYWRKRLPLKNGEFYEILVAQAPDMASVDAALLVNDIRNHWQPRAMLLVGIAGAASDEQQLGDLVLGQWIYYYERGKLTAEGSKPEPYMLKADATLWNRVTNLPDWREPISVPRPDGSQARPQIHYGVIASGEKVVADAAIRDDIAAGQRKIKALEMEGYGFTTAISQSFEQIRHLVIKAICDRADATKSDEWHGYAASVAAEFTHHFLLDRPLEPSNPPIQPTPPPSQYKPIIEVFKRGSIVPVLGPGINPQFYIQLASKLADSVGMELLDGQEWHTSRKKELIQQLMGFPCSVCHLLPEERPHECPMLTQIDRRQGCSLYIEQQLAISQVNLRCLSQYYRLKHKSLDFYDGLNEILEAINSHEPNSVHQFFAELPRQMSAKGLPKRCPGLPYQLIVTTNYDDLLERAFDQVQQPYDVVFYVAEGKEGGKFKHQPYQAEASIIDDPGKYDNNLPISKRWGGNCAQPHPIILKLYGTWDEAFVITEDHFGFLISSPNQMLPPSLINLLKESSILFLGYGSNDPELQRIIRKYWEDDQLAEDSQLVYQSHLGNLEREIWDKRGIALLNIECSLEAFLAELKREIQREIEKQIS